MCKFLFYSLNFISYYSLEACLFSSERQNGVDLDRKGGWEELGRAAGGKLKAVYIM